MTLGTDLDGQPVVGREVGAQARLLRLDLLQIVEAQATEVADRLQAQRLRAQAPGTRQRPVGGMQRGRLGELFQQLDDAGQ